MLFNRKLILYVFISIILTQVILTFGSGDATRGNYGDTDLFPECGKNTVTKGRFRRIIGGSDAYLGKWPWQVSLQFEKGNDTYHYCGGSILNSNWVVSSGHCEWATDFGGKVKVFAGLINIGSFYLWVYKESVDRPLDGLEDINPFLQESYVEKFIVFKSPTPTDLDKETMLIKLKTPLQLNDMVYPVCLPKQGKDYIPGKMCWTTGWGTTQYMGRVSPKVLQEINMPVISRQKCQGWIDDILKDDDFTTNITSNMICTGYDKGGKSPCHGDSGGPLVCYQHGRWELMGTTSWGFQCGGARHPAVFNLVPVFVDWIKNTIAEDANKATQL